MGIESHYHSKKDRGFVRGIQGSGPNSCDTFKGRV